MTHAMLNGHEDMYLIFKITQIAKDGDRLVIFLLTADIFQRH
jgi:hypothetical protein